MEEGHGFEFFQAVRLLQRLAPDKEPVGRAASPWSEAVRFRTHVSLSFPPSAVHRIAPATDDRPMPELTQPFLGLIGPSGVLPRHYTEILMRIARESRDPEADAFRAWLDLFQHRLTSLFYRAWEKYRFPLAFERGEADRDEPDSFTQVLLSLIGARPQSLRGRLVVRDRRRSEAIGHDELHALGGAPDGLLAEVPDLSLLYYSGLLAHRPRSALGLEAILTDFFGVPVAVRQFQGEWLMLDVQNQTRLSSGPDSGDHAHNRLGRSALVGDRVWEIRNKVRLVVGPVGFNAFEDFLPDTAPAARRKAIFLLAHLVRLYGGPELDFDVQLVLRAEEVPSCQLTEESRGFGPHLGWNTWLGAGTSACDRDEALFEGRVVFAL
jgi:type VI secretion system protein ImpH